MPLANKHNQNKNYFPVPLKGKNVGRDYGNVVISNYSVEGEYKLDLHRIWMPSKTITTKL